MKESNLPKGPNREKKRLGRGEGNGHGKTCCRGHKGAGARSGYSLRPGFEGGQMPLFRKLPQRGFSQARFRKPLSIVNVSDLEKINGDIVDADSLKAAGLVRPNAKRIKILGDGEINKAYKINVDFISNSAKDKIAAAGGEVLSQS